MAWEIMKDSRDKVYAERRDWVEHFTFDDSVATVFQDMITRSVPGYRTTLAMIGVITARMVQPGSRVYDLGCSLGAGARIAANASDQFSYEVLAVDASEAMVSRLRESLEQEPTRNPLIVVEQDIRETRIENASVVLLNFTLQFLPIEDRLPLLEKICMGLNPGGVLILSEKICFENTKQESTLFQLHHDFKRCNGYSDLEISQKRTALENTLIPESIRHHQSRLQAAGFQDSQVWFQCFNFASILAFK
jgi:tRNA (cmo5U34)-methyltransferase